MRHPMSFKHTIPLIEREMNGVSRPGARQKHSQTRFAPSGQI